MPYRRSPFYSRRYPSMVPSASASITAEEFPIPETSKEVETVPAPNSAEEPPEETPDIHRAGMPHFFNLLKDRIHLDDIILIGLIFLLLDEGMQDDFLLILLIYILLVGT